MRLEIGDVALDVTREQADDLRRQLGINGPVKSSELIDTAAAAKLLGTGAEYVREHARELHGQKLGTGPKARWRFDPAKLEQGSQSPKSPEQVNDSVPAPKPRRRKTSGTADLLEIRGKAVC